MTWIRPFTQRIVNPITRRFAGTLPGFGILTHVGRRSGRTYRTPLNVFRVDGAWMIALTYGSDVDWVRNVLAAGGATLRTRGRDIPLTDPVLLRDPSRRAMPLPVRIGLRLLGAEEFLRLTPRP
jgi:deazaflavin-dependent oxidoreductase (nitroreductase family)